MPAFWHRSVFTHPTGGWRVRTRLHGHEQFRTRTTPHRALRWHRARRAGPGLTGPRAARVGAPGGALRVSTASSRPARRVVEREWCDSAFLDQRARADDASTTGRCGSPRVALAPALALASAGARRAAAGGVSRRMVVLAVVARRSPDCPPRRAAAAVLLLAASRCRAATASSRARSPPCGRLPLGELGRRSRELGRRASAGCSRPALALAIVGTASSPALRRERARVFAIVLAVAIAALGRAWVLARSRIADRRVWTIEAIGVFRPCPRWSPRRRLLVASRSSRGPPRRAA